MENSNNLILALIIALAASACQKDETEYPDDPMLYFKSVEKIRGEPLHIDCLFVGYAADMHTVNHKIALLDPKQDRYTLFIIDPVEGKIIGRGLKRGAGPGEVIGTRHMHKGYETNTLLFYDTQMFRYMKINVDSVIANPKTLAETVGSFSYEIPIIYYALYLSNGHFLASAPAEEGRFLYLDTNAKIKEYLYQYPSDNHPEASNEVKALAYQIKFVRQPGGDKFASIGMFGAFIDIFETRRDQIAHLKHINFFNPHYEVARTETYTAAPIKGDGKFGFIDAAATQDHYFLLYPDNTWEGIKEQLKGSADNPKANNVLVFGWDGQPVKALKLENMAYSIAVDSKTDRLYAFESNPEPAIVAYPLKIY